VSRGLGFRFNNVDDDVKRDTLLVLPSPEMNKQNPGLAVAFFLPKVVTNCCGSQLVIISNLPLGISALCACDHNDDFTAKARWRKSLCFSNLS